MDNFDDGRVVVVLPVDGPFLIAACGGLSLLYAHGLLRLRERLLRELADNLFLQVDHGDKT